MYLSFYKLKHKPFQISTDPRFLWLGEKHEEALATLKYGVLDNKGFLLLTGDVGTGKTTLINALLNSLDKNTFVASIRDPALDPLEFFQYTAHAFGMKASNINTKVAFLIQFEEFLLEAYKNKRKVLLIIDEAQRMNQQLLEEVRLLSNIEKEESKLINIFFVGQIEFNEILLQHENRAIRQRVTISYNIETLTEQETGKYIQHRLDVASIEKVVSSFTPVQKMENGEYVRQGYTLPLPDARKEIFTPKAIQEIHKYAKGYPRLINIICDRALLTGYVEGSKTVTDSHVRECVQELEIPHSQKIDKSAKVSESAAVANINLIKTNQQSKKTAEHTISPKNETTVQAAEKVSADVTESSHSERSAQELLSDLEKLVQKKGKLPESSEQSAPLDTEADLDKSFQYEKYKNVIYFVVALAFGILLYISFSPTPLLNSDFQPVEEENKTPSGNANNVQTDMGQITDEQAAMQMDLPDEDTTPSNPVNEKETAAVKNETPNGTALPGKTASGSPSSSVSVNTEKNNMREIKTAAVQDSADTGNTSQLNDNKKDTANNIAREKDDITTKIQQLKELITFQKLVIAFAPDSTLPQDESLKKLDKLIDALRTHSSFKVTVTYYVDSNDNDISTKLIEFQAGAIKSYLMGKGLKGERITILKRDKQDISPFKTDTTSESSNHSVEIYVDR